MLVSLRVIVCILLRPSSSLSCISGSASSFTHSVSASIVRDHRAFTFYCTITLFVYSHYSHWKTCLLCFSPFPSSPSPHIKYPTPCSFPSIRHPYTTPWCRSHSIPTPSPSSFILVSHDSIFRIDSSFIFDHSTHLFWIPLSCNLSSLF